MTIEVEIDIACGNGDGREKAQAECMGVVTVLFKVGLEDVQIELSFGRIIWLEDNVFTEFVIPWCVEDESATGKVDIGDACGWCGSSGNTVGRAAKWKGRCNGDEEVRDTHARERERG